MESLRSKRTASTANPSSAPNRERAKKAAALQYEPLDPAKREIRLLEIAPGRPGSRIVGRLFHVTLDENPQYEALSYMWGPTRPSYGITINGFEAFSVGRNLRKALDDLRLPKSRVIWNDAICINQDDDGEKEHQIRLMQTIYASAQVVCAWLDHPIDPLNPCFEALQKLGKGVELDDYFEEDYWHPVADIFRNPYWRRVWVQQELILAREIKIYCHRHVFEGQQLLVFQKKVYTTLGNPFRIDNHIIDLDRYMNGGHNEMPQKARVPSGGILRAKEQFRLWWKITRPEVHLLLLFLQSAGLDMTEPRDRVYGVLGLVTEADNSIVSIDYSATVASVYSQVFRVYLEKEDTSLYFLCFNEDSTLMLTFPQFELPSWLPYCPIEWLSILASRACGTTTANNASIHPETLILSAEGLYLDTISFVSIDAESFARLPILEWLPRLEGYCRRLWPEEAKQPLYEMEEVTSLLFPWLERHRYQEMWKVERPTPEQRRALLRVIRNAPTKMHQQSLSVADILGTGFMSTYVLSSQEREMCLPLSRHIDLISFVGTEGGRLGSMHSTADVRPKDQVWILFGCPMPLVLRPVPGEENRFTLVGPAIFPGRMNGEALKMREGDEATELRGKMIEIE